jgi:hypothetical protein
MIKKLAGIVFLCGATIAAFGQEATTTNTTTKKKISARPDIPGTFMLEFGFNRDVSGPPDFSLYFWGSRTANVYYTYDFRLGKSPFSVTPGIGLSLERYKFKNNYMVAYDNNNELIMLPQEEAPVPNIKKSMLVANYVEVPLEFKYTLNPEDPGRSFKISVGGRAGFLFDSFNKVKIQREFRSQEV